MGGKQSQEGRVVHPRVDASLAPAQFLQALHDELRVLILPLQQLAVVLPALPDGPQRSVDVLLVGVVPCHYFLSQYYFTFSWLALSLYSSSLM